MSAEKKYSEITLYRLCITSMQLAVVIIQLFGKLFYSVWEICAHKTSLTPTLFIEVPLHQVRKVSSHVLVC